MNKKKKSQANLLANLPVDNQPMEDSLDVAAIEEQLKKVDDPLLALVNKYSKAITYLLLFIVIGYFGVTYYQNTKQENLRTSAKLFAELRSSYQSLVPQDGELSEAEKANLRKFQGSITTLRQQPAPYDYIARVYQTVADSDQDVSKVKSALAKINLDSVNGEQRIWAELATLSLSRKLLDTKESTYAKTQLESLAEKSVYFKSYLNKLVARL